MKRRMMAVLLLFMLALPLAVCANAPYVLDYDELLTEQEDADITAQCEALYAAGTFLVIYTKAADGEDVDTVLEQLEQQYPGETGLLFYTDLYEGYMRVRAFGDPDHARFPEAQIQEMVDLAADTYNAEDYYQSCERIIAYLSGEDVGYTSGARADGSFRGAVTDEAGYLSWEARTALSERLQAISDQYGMVAAVYVQASMSGYDAQETAEAYYRQSFGEKNGILLYISKSPRKYWYAVYGEQGNKTFNSNGQRYIDDSVLPYLKENDYEQAVTVFADKTEQLMQMAANGRPYNQKPLKTQLIFWGIALVVPLIIAFVSMRKKLALMKTANHVLTAENYVQPGSMQLTNSKDVYLYSHVAATKKPERDSGSRSSGGGFSGRGGDY